MKTYTNLIEKTKIKSTHLLLIPLLFCISGLNAQDIDWSKAESKSVTVFYPGVTSWEFLKNKDHGTGAKPVIKDKKSCEACHINKKGKWDIAADDIISGELTMIDSEAPFEPKPKEGMAGYMNIKAQAAYDTDHIYIKLSWPSAGTSFADAAIAEQGLADRVSIQFANKGVKTFIKSGCFITCHADLKDMPKSKGDDKKLYAEFSIKKGKPLPQKMLDMYLSKGRIIDQWVGAFHGSKVVTSDEYILQDRIEDINNVEASGTFANNEYSITFKRQLNTGDTGDIVLKAGGQVNISIAIHEAKSNSRFHYTSFPLSLGLDSKKADLKAMKL